VVAGVSGEGEALGESETDGDAGGESSSELPPHANSDNARQAMSSADSSFFIFIDISPKKYFFDKHDIPLTQMLRARYKIILQGFWHLYEER
jgi:hypothetical protein